MSSEISIKYLTSEDLNMLQRVLRNAGYTDDVVIDQPRPCNLAAVLMIRLFQEGMTSPAELTIQLERHFGKPRKEAMAFAGSSLHRFAIQGLPIELRRTVH